MPTSRDYLSDPTLGLVREARPAQLAMAASVEQVLRDGGAYFVEAPVATGKTYAYLLPSLLAAGRRVVVATAKKQLQDQIVDKDLPALKRAVGGDLKSVISTPLKGKGNYACRLGAASAIARGEEGGAGYSEFLRRSTYGDRAEFPGSPPRWWAQATAEDCVGKKCEHYDECGFIRLRRAVTSSRLIVINHHVLGAEMFFGHGKMVGGPYDVLIIDEAHTLAAGIRSAFSHKLSEDSIDQLRDLLARTSHVFPSVRRLMPAWEAMFEAVPRRGFDSETREAPVFSEGLAAEVVEGLRAAAREIAKTLTSYGPKDEEDEGPDEDDIYLGGEDPNDAIEIEDREEAIAEGSARVMAILNQGERRVDALLRGMQAAQGVVDPDPTGDPEAEDMRRARILANTAVYSTSDERGRFAVQCAPVNVGGIAGRYLSTVKTVVVCSATLAIDGSFDHVTSMTGLVPARSEVLPTSFNYDAQGFAYIPRDLPVVGRKDPDYEESMRKRVERAVRLVELSDGGAFILTTANDELDAFAAALRERFPGRTFAQGHRKNPHDGDPNAALAKFRATRDAILVGSKSFWEGVDVPGGDLRLVIMAKLPFPLFSDPIVKAREKIAGKENAFRDVQLADMLTDLRQGVGRLIRTRLDRGCAAILDSRIWTKSYGGQVRRALPWSNNTVTSDLAVCERYLPRFAAHFKRVAAAPVASATAP